MIHSLKGLLAAAIVGGLMWLGWNQYRNFLYQGQKPTESTKVLNEMAQQGVPEFSLEDIRGQKVSLADFREQVVIVNFWASWCDPCVEEFPSLLKLISHYKGKVILLAISADHSEEDMLNFLKAFKVEGPHIKVMWDKEQEVAKKFGTFVLPESYILGRENRFVRKIAGVDDWSSSHAFRFFDELLK